MNKNYMKNKILKMTKNAQVMPSIELRGTFCNILGLLFTIISADALVTELAPGIKLKVFSWWMRQDSTTNLSFSLVELNTIRLFCQSIEWSVL